jgi:hypothetical protein
MAESIEHARIHDALPKVANENTAKQQKGDEGSVHYVEEEQLVGESVMPPRKWTAQ